MILKIGVLMLLVGKVGKIIQYSYPLLLQYGQLSEMQCNFNVLVKRDVLLGT